MVTDMHVASFDVTRHTPSHSHTTTTPHTKITPPHHTPPYNTTPHHTTKHYTVTDTVPVKLLERATPLNRNLDEANIFRFDVESHSLKYVKCQMIEMFKNEVSE